MGPSAQSPICLICATSIGSLANRPYAHLPLRPMSRLGKPNLLYWPSGHLCIWCSWPDSQLAICPNVPLAHRTIGPFYGASPLGPISPRSIRSICTSVPIGPTSIGPLAHQAIRPMGHLAIRPTSPSGLWPIGPLAFRAYDPLDYVPIDRLAIRSIAQLAFGQPGLRPFGQYPSCPSISGLILRM